jgi:hypothetical protein
MDRRTAAALLGVEPDSPLQLVRARYRSLLMEAHPDRSRRADAAQRTMQLTAAYRVLQRDTATSPSARPGPPPRPPTGHPGPGSPNVGGPASSHSRRAPRAASDRGEPTLLGATTIGLALPEPLAMAHLLEVASQLGEVTYLDRSAGLLEVVVEFVEAPTSSVVLTVVGHERGSRVDCGVEPLSGGPAPAVDAVTRLVLRALRGDDPAG